LLQNPYVTHLTLGMLLHYLVKLKTQIFCRYSADMDESAKNCIFNPSVNLFAVYPFKYKHFIKILFSSLLIVDKYCSDVCWHVSDVSDCEVCCVFCSCWTTAALRPLSPTLARTRPSGLCPRNCLTSLARRSSQSFNWCMITRSGCPSVNHGDLLTVSVLSSLVTQLH